MRATRIPEHHQWGIESTGKGEIIIEACQKIWEPAYTIMPQTQNLKKTEQNKDTV